MKFGNLNSGSDEARALQLISFHWEENLTVQTMKERQHGYLCA